MAVQQEFKIDFKPTGDPFVDGGGLALEFWMEQNPGKSIPDVIKEVAAVFVKKWATKINTLFLNSKITNPSVKEKVKETVKFYNDMIKLSNPQVAGDCRICGNHDSLFPAGREQFCLAGSGPFVNFHHGHEDGIYICKRCTIKLFFLPLAVVQLGRNLGLLHTVDHTIKAYWQKKIIEENYNKVGRNSSKGILKSEYGNPVNAIFYFAAEIIALMKRKEINCCLQLYHFSNFGANPDCDLYTLPGDVFRFLYIMHKQNFTGLWHYFIKAHYRLKKNFQWDANTGEWMELKNNGIFAETEYKNNGNVIFNYLLAGKSILPYLRKFFRKLYINENKLLNSLLAAHYAKEVLDMKQEQIALIKELGMKIFNIAKQENDFKKYLVLLEKAGKAYQLRYALMKLVKKNFTLGNQEPLLRIDDYLNYLFPDGQFWGEVRDLLLIFLYEKMHENNMQCEDLDEDIRETIEESTEF